MRSWRKDIAPMATAAALALPLALALLISAPTAVAVAQEGEVPAGQQIFEAQKCYMCHSVSTVGIESKTQSEKMFGGDLVDVDEKHDAAFLIDYLKKATTKEDAEHKREFKGTDEELQTLVDWLLAQQTN